MKRIFALVSLLLSLAIVYQSCSTVKQVSEMSRLNSCEFSFEGIQSLRLAGIDLGDGTSSEGIQGGQLMQLVNAMFQKNIPISLDVMMKVDNPNSKAATVSRMDYIILLEGMEMLNGETKTQYTIGPNSSEILPLPLQTELFTALAAQNREDITRLINKFTGKDQEPMEVTVKVKPYISIGLTSLPYPGYLTFTQKIQKN